MKLRIVVFECKNISAKKSVRLESCKPEINLIMHGFLKTTNGWGNPQTNIWNIVLHILNLSCRGKYEKAICSLGPQEREAKFSILLAGRAVMLPDSSCSGWQRVTLKPISHSPALCGWLLSALFNQPIRVQQYICEVNTPLFPVKTPSSSFSETPVSI